MSPTKKTISLLLADDHKLLLDTMASTLALDKRFTVCGKAQNSEEAIRIAKQKHPDIILMDISLGQPDGFETTKLVRKVSPGSKVIGLTMFAFPAYAEKMKACGASGYVTKSSSTEELMNAIIEVHNGHYYLCQQVKDLIQKHELLHRRNEDAGPESLTNREIEVIQLIKDGLTSKEIASKLKVSPNTINIHRNNIFRKLQVGSVTAMLSLIQMLGL